MLHLKKVLHLLPEKDIMETLKDFRTTEENNMNNTENTEVGLVVLDEKDIIETDTQTIKLNPNLTRVAIYQYNKATYNILTKVFSNKVIIRVEFIRTQDIILDMTYYESVKNTYNILSKLNYKVESDNDLITLATQKIVPNKKLVVIHKQLGNLAFPNSKVKQYKLKAVYCYDLSLILETSIPSKEVNP